jgi:hypothetical protein
MLPSVEDWLSASWADYRRRWLPLMSVLALTGLATAAAVFLPLIPAGLASYAGAGSPWLVWTVASLVSLLAGLWFSAWAQAAAMRSASNDESASASLGAGWKQTAAFAWVLSLVMLAAGGGFVLLILPGLIITALLFFAPYYQMAGEDGGMGAIELSYARVKPQFGAVCGRIALVGTIVWLPSWIPYAGWLIAPLWAPFGLVACARLANDLKELNPAPARPALGGAIAALSMVFVAASFAATWGAARAGTALYESYASGKLALKAPDAETAQALLAMIQGEGTEQDRARSRDYVLSISSGALAAP